MAFEPNSAFFSVKKSINAASSLMLQKALVSRIRMGGWTSSSDEALLEERVCMMVERENEVEDEFRDFPRTSCGQSRITPCNSLANAEKKIHM